MVDPLTPEAVAAAILKARKGTYMKRHALEMVTLFRGMRPGSDADAWESELKFWFPAMVIYRNAPAIVAAARKAMGYAS
jgi:hypothetical protein